MAILKLATKLNIGFAFPSQTLYMEQFPEKETSLPNYNTNPDFIQKQLTITTEELKEKFKTHKK